MCYRDRDPESQRVPLWQYLVAAVCLILVAIAFLSTLTQSCKGGEIMYEYPAEVAGMSDEVFFDWATRFNEQQVREIVRSSEPKWLYSYGVRTRVTRGVSDMQIVRERYPRRYLNPDYFPPSALTVINPYCKPKR